MNKIINGLLYADCVTSVTMFIIGEMGFVTPARVLAGISMGLMIALGIGIWAIPDKKIEK